MIAVDAIVFDFDGVLAESVEVKGAAFVALYEDESPEIQKQVLAYHEANGGVNRYDKIRYFETSLCGREVDESGVMGLANRFSALVEQKVIEAAWVTGAKAFLDRNRSVPFYIVSATPQEELVRIVGQRGMADYFRGVYGAPVKKDEHLEDIIEAHRYQPDRILMVGDAMADYEAAEKTGVHFIGRVPPGKGSPFPAGTTLIKDLTELGSLIKLPV